MIDGWFLAVVIVLVVGVLGAMALRRGAGLKASGSIGVGVTELSLHITQHQREAAKESTRAASRQRQDEASLETAIDQIDSVLSSSRRRILWVDDFPDNSLYESTALLQLLYLITIATSTAAALHYLRELPFDPVITDMGRGDRSTAGVELLEAMRTRGHMQPVIVYTGDAQDARAEAAQRAGAVAVLDTPGALIAGVLEHCAPSRHPKLRVSRHDGIGGS